MLKTTLWLPWAVCGPNSHLSYRKKWFPWVQENTIGFILPIGLRSAIQLPPRMNTEFNPIFISWAGAGETCCTGAEVRGSKAEMQWLLSWWVLHTAGLVFLVLAGCHQRQVEICQPGRTPQRGKSKPAPFFRQCFSCPQSLQALLLPPAASLPSRRGRWLPQCFFKW